MAMRRMISRQLAESDPFLDLPLSARGLYLHLVTSADDDGLLGHVRALLRMTGATQADLDALVNGGFVLPLPDGVYAIRHWLSQNRVRRDRYTPTVYTQQRQALDADESGNYFLCNVWQPSLGQVSSGQDSLVQSSLGQDSSQRSAAADQTDWTGQDEEPTKNPDEQTPNKANTLSEVCCERSDLAATLDALAQAFLTRFSCPMGRLLRQAARKKLAQGMPAAQIEQLFDRALAFSPRNPNAYVRALLERPNPDPPAPPSDQPAPLADWEQAWLTQFEQRRTKTDSDEKTSRPLAGSTG